MVDSQAVPERIGRYLVVREIGRGGMGVVYEAEQDEPKRRVALKVMRDVLGSDEIQRRFERESELLGQLQHPGIAHVYEAGAEQIGGQTIPYFAMEYIDGYPLDVHVRTVKPGQRDVLELFARVCDAVQHAHQKGIIHRDLKPANVLVKREQTGTSSGTRSDSASTTMIDAIGQPKVLDFGVARLSEPDAQATLQTQTGQIIGTLAYMSPEQIDGDALAVDTRCDVYAIGVMLYQVLGGRMPIDISGKPVAEAARLLRTEEPRPLGALDAALRGDVETIVAKAMDPDRERRYASAAALADDLRRYLNNEPIAARPATARYQLAKFVRRNRALVGGVAATFVVLVLGVIGTAYGLMAALRTNEELAHSNTLLEATNEELEQANADLTAVSEFQANQLREIDVLAMGTQMRQELLDATSEEQRDELRGRLTDVNFTDLARDTLKRNIFDPSLTLVDEEFKQQPIVQARLLQGIGTALRDLGLKEAATDPMERSLATLREKLGEREEFTIDAELGMAMLLHLKGQYEEAEAAYKKVEALGGAALGPDDDLVLTAMNNRANLREGQGHYDEAFEVYEVVLAARRAKYGDEHTATAATLSQLALNLLWRGKFAESEQMLREALELQRKLLGPEDSETLSTQSYLAAALFRLGRLDEAVEVGQAALEGRRRTHGEDHPYTLISLSNVGVFLVEAGRVEEAEPYYLETLASRRRVSGPDHPETLTALNNVGFFYARLKRYDDAEQYYRAAYEGNTRVMGAEHHATLQTLQNLATNYTRMKNYEKANEIFEDLIARRTKASGPEHLDTLGAMAQAARSCLWDKDFEQAERWITPTFEIYERVHGVEHPDTLDAFSILAGIREGQGRFEEADALYQRTLTGRLNVLDENHPDVATARKDLQRLQEKMAERESAE